MHSHILLFFKVLILKVKRVLNEVCRCLEQLNLTSIDSNDLIASRIIDISEEVDSVADKLLVETKQILKEIELSEPEFSEKMIMMLDEFINIYELLDPHANKQSNNWKKLNRLCKDGFDARFNKLIKKKVVNADKAKCCGKFFEKFIESKLEMKDRDLAYQSPKVCLFETKIFLDLLKTHIAELEAENAKLRQTIKEKSDLKTENSKHKAKNAKLKVEVAKLRHDIEKIKLQIQVNANEQDASFIEDILQFLACLELLVTLKAQRLKAKPASLEDKKINEFLDSKYKEKLSELLYDAKTTKIVKNQNTEPASEESIKVISRNKESDIPVHTKNDKYIAIKLAHLYQKARKAKKNTVYAKREEILNWYYYIKEIEKIKQIKSYSANKISKLTNPQIQHIIDYFADESYKKIIVKCQLHNLRSYPYITKFSNSNDLSETEIYICIFTKSQITNSSDSKTKISISLENKITKINAPLIPQVNTPANQYSNLYREFSSENFNYYKITDNISCPLCKLDYDNEESIKGGHLINLKPENKVSDLSFSEQCKEKEPIMFKAKPDPELIIKSMLEYFTYLKFQNSFREINNYSFVSPQLWSSPCSICNRKHENYRLHSE
ncbi:10652_t:CDS:10 [Cetraspora pellucida]|uniref:10652_t:CDS:1 n=1 Tax=Cetraspora pellucida TaxID=1433469 RepID=A0A9N9BB62_9GLOM|nr:10652_t:CDS:10 [Cetraspora pellucida]